MSEFELGAVLYRPNNGFVKIVSVTLCPTHKIKRYGIEYCDEKGEQIIPNTNLVFGHDFKQAIIVTDENRPALAAIQSARKEMNSLIDLLFQQRKATEDNSKKLELLLQINVYRKLI